MDGIFNIYKEKGFTSHDVVAIVRRTIHMKKAVSYTHLTLPTTSRV